MLAIASLALVLCSVILRLVLRGTRSGFYSSHALTILSGLPDHLVEHICGLVYPVGVEHQVDVVVLVETVG